MIDVAIPKFHGDAEKNVTTRPPLAVATRHTSFAQSKSKVPKVDDDEEDLHIAEDTASEDSDNDDDGEEEEDKGAKDEFFDTPDIADGVSRCSFESIKRCRVLCSQLTRVFDCNRNKTLIRRLSNSPSRSIEFKLQSSAHTSIRSSRISSSQTLSSKGSSLNSVFDLTT